MAWPSNPIRIARLAAFFAALALAPLGTAALAFSPEEEAAERAEMVRTIQLHARGLPALLGDEGIAPEVLTVMREVRRHLFVPEQSRRRAYDDRPLKIGYGQTISQPFIVALMTHLLVPKPGDVMLEIGTGSGYQAAVLSPLIERVCTIEIVPQLGRRAEALLAALDYDDIDVKVADGYFGWPECGPFDGIVVTAAAGHVPPPLVEQLKPGGRMIIPVGGPFAVQYLTVVEKSATGQVTTRQVLPVRFVPFTRSPQ